MPDQLIPWNPGPTSTPPPADSSGGSLFGQLPAGFHAEVASAIHAAKNVTGLVDKAAAKLSARTGWDISKATKHVQDFLTESEESQTRKADAHGAPKGVAGSVLRAVGAAPVQMAEYAGAYAITRYRTAAYALVDAAKDLDKGVGRAALSGAVGAASGLAMEGAAKLPLKARVPLGAAIGSGSTAILGGSASDILTGGIAGGAFAAIPSGKKNPTPLKERIDAVTGAAEEHMDSLRKEFAPHLRGSSAKEGALILREQNARADLNYHIALQRGKASHEYFQNQSPDANLDFARQIDVGGDIKKLPADQQPFATQVKGMLDDIRDALHKAGILKHYYDQYFPRSGMWEDPKQAADAVARAYSKRPFAGRKGFAKERVALTIDDMLKLGVKPKDQNVMDLVFNHVREANKALAADAVLKEYKAKGIADLVLFGKGKGRGKQPHQADWKPLGRDVNDTTFVKYGPPKRKVTVSYPDPNAPKGKGKVTKDVRTGGLTIMGQWYAAPEVADVMNNYLSPGLQGNKIYDSIYSVGNVLNQYQLGLSGFHLGFTAVDSAISNTASALHYLSRGKPIKAAATLLQTPISPFQYYIEGNKVLKGAMSPGSQGGHIASVIDKIVRGGGRMQIDERYRTNMAQQMREAFARGDIGTGVFKSAFVPGEYLSNFIMGKIVPRMKLGALSQLVNMEMETRPNATQDQWREAIASAVDSIDNRMGQVIYKNWFVNPYLRDIMHIGMRSVGWNTGTFKELGGGVADVRKMISKHPELSYKLAYTFSMPIVVATLGAMYQVMMTGKWPETTLDYFHPKSGSKDQYGKDKRVSFPSYMKDLESFHHDPVGTISNKVNPLFGSIAEMLRNKDFYGKEISSPKYEWLSPDWYHKAMDYATYGAEQFEPFSLRNMEQATDEGGNTGEIVGPFVGITQAPKYVSQSPAEQLASRLAARRMPEGGKSEESFDRSQKIRELQQKMRNHPEAISDMRDALKTGDLGRSDVRNLSKDKNASQLQRLTTTLNLDESLDVWEKATAEEKRQMLPIITRKIRGVKNLPAKEQVKLLERLRHDLAQLPVSTQAPPPKQPAIGWAP